MMVANTMPHNLLEDLAAQVGCVYLSDLRNARLLPDVFRCLQGIVPTAYSLQQWQDLVHYLIGKQQQIATVEEAKAQLLIFAAPEKAKEPVEKTQSHRDKIENAN